jgi:arginine deiminase
MLFDLPAEEAILGDSLIRHDLVEHKLGRRWGVDSGYGRLTDVMVSPPPPIEIARCDKAEVDAIARGLECGSALATRQHKAFVRALRDEGVRCATVPASEKLPDMSFMRDVAVMTPWGLLDLRPAGPRLAEAAYVRDHARGWGVPYVGALEEGRAEGGDICVLRPGLVAIGWSGERTDKQGALALARFFEAHGWKAILTHFDPYFRHLDTLFGLAGRNRALACVEALDPAFVGQARTLGIDLVPITPSEVQRLAANVLSLGGGCVLSSAENSRVNLELARLGHRVVAVDIGQFTRRGGGAHSLTMPLARLPG